MSKAEGKEGRKAASVVMGEKVAVKLSGKTLETVIVVKHKLESDRGAILSVAEVVREAVEAMARSLNVYEEEEDNRKK